MFHNEKGVQGESEEVGCASSHEKDAFMKNHNTSDYKLFCLFLKNDDVGERPNQEIWAFFWLSDARI